MKSPKPEYPYETLDPEDWGAMRELGHKMVDDMLDYMETVAERRPWQRAPESVKAHFKAGVPFDPQPADEIYEEFLEYVLPYPIGNIHPRFWGWIFGTGTVMGAFAEFLAAAMNTNAGDIDHHSANHVEKQVLSWIKEMLGYPSSASGLLTSGCSAANLIGLDSAQLVGREIADLVKPAYRALKDAKVRPAVTAFFGCALGKKSCCPPSL